MADVLVRSTGDRAARGGDVACACTAARRGPLLAFDPPWGLTTKPGPRPAERCARAPDRHPCALRSGQIYARAASTIGTTLGGSPSWCLLSWSTRRRSLALDVFTPTTGMQVRPLYLKTLTATTQPCVQHFTIHTARPGPFRNDCAALDLPWDLLGIERSSSMAGHFLKAGINYATCITTVRSEYAQEIHTPELGFRFDGILPGIGGPRRQLTASTRAVPDARPPCRRRSFADLRHSPRKRSSRTIRVATTRVRFVRWSPDFENGGSKVSTDWSISQNSLVCLRPWSCGNREARMRRSGATGRSPSDRSAPASRPLSVAHQLKPAPTSPDAAGSSLRSESMYSLRTDRASSPGGRVADTGRYSALRRSQGFVFASYNPDLC